MKPWMIIAIIGGAVAIVLAGFVGLSLFWQHQQTSLLDRVPQHGTTFVLQYDSSRADANTLWRLQETLRKRLSHFGTRMFWEAAASNQVRVSVPIDSPQTVQAASHLILQGGNLEFRLVHENNDNLIKDGALPEGYELLKQTIEQIQPPKPPGTIMSGIVIPIGAKGPPPPQGVYMVKIKPEMTGDHIESAYISRDQLGRPQINFKLNAEGANEFQKITGDNVGRQLAIVLDGQLQSVPRIQSPISGGSAVIAGNFKDAEAQTLAGVLDSPLPMPLKIIETKTF